MRKASHHPLLRPGGVPLSAGPLLLHPLDQTCSLGYRPKRASRALPMQIPPFDRRSPYRADPGYRTKMRACSYCSSTALHRRMKFTPNRSQTMLGFSRSDSPDRIRAKSPNTVKSQPSGSAFARFSANRASQPEHRPSACCYSPRSQACRSSSPLQLPKTIALNRNDGSGKGAIVASSFDIARLRLAARLSSCNADRLSSARRFPSRNMAWSRSTRGMPPLDEAYRRMTALFAA